MTVLRSVSSSRIDFFDQRFRISSDIWDDSLEASVKKLGLLSPPALLERGDAFVPITGHNKFEILAKYNILPREVDAMVFDELDEEFFLKRILLKNERGELGPFGKIRAMAISGNMFPETYARSKQDFFKDLAIPSFISHNFERPLGLPLELQSFLDFKKISYRIIKDIMGLSPELIEALGRFVSKGSVKVNIFRKLVDIIFDLSGGEFEKDCVTLLLENVDDGASVFSSMFEMRYPVYSHKKEESHKIIASVKKGGVEVDFPEYFEKDRFFIKIPILSRDKEEEIKKRFYSIDLAKIQELGKLL